MGQEKKPLKIDPVLICLGQALQVRIGDAVYKWKVKDKMGLYSSVDGKKLFIIQTAPKKITPAEFLAKVDSNQAKVDKGIALYERWHECEPVSGSIMVPPKGFLFHVGRVASLLYSSDKWTSKKTRYIHDFKQKPIGWVNSKKAPKALVLTGGKIQVKADGITG